LGRPKLRSRRAGTGQINLPAEPAGIAMLESNVADILADYREWRDQQAARVSTHSDRCHLWHRDCMIHRLADALERAISGAGKSAQAANTPPTLTDEERTFLRMVRDTYAMQDDDEVCGMIAASISGLLERTK
jgi:hypothetical protein